MKKDLLLLGAQWGDEGKGKVVDLLSSNYQIVIRYQGGSNAGHTVVVGGEKFILHLLPTGMLHHHTTGIVAQGMVLDLELLKGEIEHLEARGISVRERLLVSDRAHLVMPYHKLLDALLERKSKIGTTLRGIGPSYMFKYGRKGIRVCDLEDKNRLYKLIREDWEFVKDICEKIYCENHSIDIDKVYEETLNYYEFIKDCVIDVSRFLMQNADKGMLFEGAQGTMLDVDMGTYPYVTSSNASALGLPNGTGLSPKFFTDTFFLGVSKAYTTRVGEGPFPTELFNEEGENLRNRGKEYGSTTGRPRRCGWLDLVALKYAVDINSLDGLILTKLDVLDTFEEIKVCVGYEYEGRYMEHFPASLSVLEKVRPVYKTFKGWLKDTKGAKRPEDLPERAKDYINFIETYTGVPVVMLSTGPERDEYLWIKPFLQEVRV
ncbi:adenylosuccinate synthase [Hydrogenobacter hydrogenophilus]|uniref:Adenylosuccinate synthetase n=1 Tax=Hydrogenobacter hydrogenophilus TaxID=35835 RepID=A0A285P0H9_9AQUI|nr:adenylosuccinate synthase [Hydrogenobacter hydrogenophilus]SNZ14673.1 Adenylosuccinate synthetase [Hydrogenobacter hydrogenophilus]